METRDPRDYQILFLASFLALGLLARDWTLQLAFIPVVFLACTGTQILLAYLEKFVKSVDKHGFPLYKKSTPKIGICQFLSETSLKSSLITALGLCLLLRGNHYQTMVFAGVLAIASKFIFRDRGKHFFNPGNFGIISALVWTGDAWVSPGQWGTDWIYLLFFCATAGMILQRVGRWETSGTFLLVYGGLELCRDYRLGWTGDVWLHQVMNGSLLLFAFFMITDPRSIPNSPIARIFWASAVAGLTFFLQHTFFLSTAPFWALFILSPATVILDRVRSARRFSWEGRENLPVKYPST
ncbi:RnfABCDGE type electron transport complex subunit D [Pannus brasiliensis CCIBt3594]|uniref:RnfABCDGE type electron transport complex subunit D n=1 Tax=Pannus brasiliensis CCIBt3594 TaxID=1427578 RepID=A0AAW9QVT5_9CHRO